MCKLVSVNVLFTCVCVCVYSSDGFQWCVTMKWKCIPGSSKTVVKSIHLHQSIYCFPCRVVVTYNLDTLIYMAEPDSSKPVVLGD